MGGKIGANRPDAGWMRSVITEIIEEINFLNSIHAQGDLWVNVPCKHHIPNMIKTGAESINLDL